MRSRLLPAFVAGATLLGAAAVAGAQPGVIKVERHDHVDVRGHVDVRFPNLAPPPLRVEHAPPRRGYEWIAGRWDWRGGQWAWVGGRYEAEHPGQHWTAGHWDRGASGWAWTEGAYMGGGGVDVAIGVPPPGPVEVVVTTPTFAPPPPRDERFAARAGFDWIPGRWDWRNRRWEWLAGRYEPVHAGQHWAPGRWQQNGAAWAWVDGNYIAAEQPLPPPPPPPPAPLPPPPDMPPPHDWHIDRPTVSSFWPAKGQPGARVVIRGTNFAPDTQVMWGPQAVVAAKVESDKIVFNVPPGAASATILLKRDHGHDLIVGNFDVSNYDADAEAKRIEAERVAAAQASWNAQQARYAHDQAERQAAMDAQWAQMDTDRAQRRAARLAEIRAKWQAAFLADPDTQAELSLHAQRVAELERAKDIAGVTANAKLGVRIDVATARESDRHDQRMAALQAAFNARGGQP